ncbi:MAG: hypothetical protein AAGA48_36195 [Myxococcota bacterium]
MSYPEFQLSSDTPLLMLPVRLETVYSNADLLIRVFPDVFHADAHPWGLSPNEESSGQMFWNEYVKHRGDSTAQLQSFSWLVSMSSPWRAAWIARVLQPDDVDEALSEPPGALVPPLVFPSPPPGDFHKRVMASLLPDRWVAIGYRQNEIEFEVSGPPIQAGLAMGPDLAATIDPLTELDASTFLTTQGLDWMRDFTAAEAAGMGIRVNLASHPAVLNQIDDLVVIGVTNQDRAFDLEQLLVAHQFSHGLGLLPQGMPTNNANVTRSGKSASNPDLQMLLALAVDPPGTSSLPPGLTPAAEAVYAYDQGTITELALGLPGNSALQNVDRARDPVGERSRAMGDCLWPVTWGWLLTKVFDIGAYGQFLRDWSHNWLQGGAPLGTLQVGKQPFGIVPHMELRSFTFPLPTSDEEQFENVLGWMRFLDWVGALQHVKSLNPEAPSAHIAGETASEAVDGLAKVLGGVPHPTQFRIRGASNQRTTIQDAYRAPTTGYKDQAIAHISAAGATSLVNDLAAKLPTWDANAAPPGLVAPYEDSIGWELIVWESAVADLQGRLPSPSRDTAIQYIQSTVLPHLENHFERSKAPEHFPSHLDLASSIENDAAPPIYWAEHDQDAESWTGPLVSADGDPTTVADWLGDLADVIENGSPMPAPPAGHPLLFQLLVGAVDAVTGLTNPAFTNGEALAVKDGLRRLQGLMDGSSGDQVDDPIAELTWLMREVLGLATHRLDAWEASFALKKLAEMRAVKPNGLFVGGYGWVTDLQRDMSQEGPSQGYLHAPSMNHATTAGILRSGWNVLGSDQAGSTVAVDLTSDRVRKAHWILDGVRRGRDLAELLGQRLERSLHDEGLNVWIDDIRLKVREAAGEEDLDISRVVDGLVLARAFSDANDLTPLEQDTFTGVSAFLDSGTPTHPGAVVPPEGYRPEDVRTLLEELGADFDSCSDVLIAQAVHGLVQGTNAVAYQSLASLGSGDATIPEIDVTRTPQRSRTLTHRVIVPFTASSTFTAPVWPGADTSPFRFDAPHLESWVASLLPDPSDVVCEVAWSWNNSFGDAMLETVQLRMADLGLSALDAIFMTLGSDRVEASSLGRWVRRNAWSFPPDSAHPPQGQIAHTLNFERTSSMTDTQVSFDEWVLLARELAHLLEGARPLADADLRVASPSGADDDFSWSNPGADLTCEIQLELDIISLELAISAGESLVGPMMLLARWGFADAIPSTIYDPTAMKRQADRLVVAARERLADAHEKRDAMVSAWSTLDPEQQRRRLIERICTVVGRKFPPGGIAGSFGVSSPGDLTTTFGHHSTRVPDTLGVRGWLRQLGTVRKGMGGLSRVLDLSEALSDGLSASFETGQLPHSTNDGWFATSKPAAHDLADHLHLVRMTLPGTSFGGEAMFGFVVDAWPEALPEETQETGLAIHFDAPSARAPNALLLLVPTDHDGWAFTPIRNKVKSVLDGARYRTVGPEHEERWGQYLPAIFMDANTNASGGAP